jgi:hypothetical protein
VKAVFFLEQTTSLGHSLLPTLGTYLYQAGFALSNLSLQEGLFPTTYGYTGLTVKENPVGLSAFLAKKIPFQENGHEAEARSTPSDSADVTYYCIWRNRTVFLLTGVCCAYCITSI